MHLHEILEKALARFGDRALHIIETGTIRDSIEETGFVGDGWSTLFFAERQKRTSKRFAYDFTSIDLNTSVAEKVLTEHKLREYVHLMTNASVVALTDLAIGATAVKHKPNIYDVIFLDSANNADLIYSEFLIAQRLIKSGGLIIVDDVRMPHQPVGAFKGDLVWPYVKEQGIKHEIFERTGWRNYKTGVLVIEGR